MKKVMILLVIIGTLAASNSDISAHFSPIDDGLSWLLNHQALEGYWGDSMRTPLRDTCAVIATLSYLKSDNNPNYSNGVQWLLSSDVTNIDSLSQRILSLSLSGKGIQDDITALVSLQNTNGGWGLYYGHRSDPFDTALALQALKAVNYPDQNIISSAISYLTSTQNSDGGWGFYKGDESNMYMTAIVLSTLSQFKSTYNLQTHINNAVAYLLAHQNADGGFGSSTGSESPSTVFETALTFEALLASGAVGADKAANIQNAISYITYTQLPNGSWNNDPYSTALALRALHISSNQTPPPTTGTATGKVIDASTNQPLSGVSLILQSDSAVNTNTDSVGNFILSDIPAGSQTIIVSVIGYGTASTTIDVTAGSIVNVGSIPLSSSPATGIIKGTVADAATSQPLDGVAITLTGSYNGSVLTSSTGSFLFADVTPGTITISAAKAGYYSVAVTGTVHAGEVVSFNPIMSTQPPPATTGSLMGKVFDVSTNNPVQGATITVTGGPSANSDAEGVFLVGNIPSGTYQVIVSATGYVNQLYQVMIAAGVTADLQTIYLTSLPQSTTLTGKVSDSSTGNPVAGADVSVTGTAISGKTASDGTYNITGISLLEFDVKAAASGYEVQGYHLTTTGFGTLTVNFNLNPNQLSNLKAGSVTFSNPSPAQGDTVTINAEILNTGYSQAANILVRFYEGDPANGGTQIGPDQTVPSLSPNGSATVGVPYDTSGKTGRHGIFIKIDPLDALRELDETDNSSTAYLTILLPPDLFIDSSQITYAPTNPTVDTPLTVSFIVRNLGEKDVANVPLRLYKGDPANGGVVLNNYTIPLIKGNSQSELKATINDLAAGSNTFFLVADPDNIIAESNELNNTGNTTINVDASKATDLSIQPANITLMLPPNAKQGDVFTINAVVKNAGSADVQTHIAFFNGDPTAGVLMDRKTVTIPAFGINTVTAGLTLPSSSAIIYVFVDPDNLIPETDEANNLAFIQIGSSNLPDLLLTDQQVKYYPTNPTPRTKVTIEANLFNYGGSGTYSSMNLYEGMPESGGILKGSLSFYYSSDGNYMNPFESRVGHITLTNLTVGEHTFYVVADPDNRIQEVNETNNRAKVKITVTADREVDLYVRSEDITFSPELPLAGELVQIKATLHNSGNEPVTTHSSLYNGNPSGGGKLIYGGGSPIDQDGTYVWSFYITMPNEVPEIYVVMDDYNQVTETNESNNIASRTIDTYKNDLSISTRDISLDPAIPEKGDTVAVLVNVHSTGLTSRTATLELYEGSPENGVLIGSQNFAAQGKQIIQVSFPAYVYRADGTTLTAVIENLVPAQDDPTNNRASASFGEHIEDGASNEGTDFWLAWPPTYQMDAGIVIQSKYLASVTVTLPSSGGTYMTWTGSVSPDAPSVLPVRDSPNIQLQSAYNNLIQNRGIHITSDKEVSVAFHAPLRSNVADDSYLALPTNILGTDYYIMDYVPCIPSQPAGYTVIAIEDNTAVNAGGDIITLNRGQTYHHNSTFDLTGAHIKSNKPIAVFGSVFCADVPHTVPRTAACDSLLEQMLPVALYSIDYFTAPLYSPRSSDVFRVLASENNSEIVVNHGYHSDTVYLDAGGWAEFDSEDAVHITSNKPIMVTQYAKGLGAAGVGDPFQMTMIPTDKLKSEYIFYAHPGYEDGDFVTVIAPEPDTAVMLDGVLIDTGWAPLPDKGNYILMPVKIGEHVVSANKPIAVYSHGYRLFGSYGYPAGFSIPAANLKIDNVDMSPSSPANGQLVEITALLTNDGDKPAKNVLVRAYNGDPLNGGLQIGGDVYLDIVNPKETKTVTFIWDTHGYTGTNNIYIIGDPSNTVKESNEADNTAMITVEVIAALKPDLAITPSDIALSKEIVNEGEMVTITATMKNRGSATSNIPVSLYLGDPKTGGLLIGNSTFMPIVPSNGEASISFTITTVGLPYINDLYVVIDPENTIDELDKKNNKASKRLMVNRRKLSLDVVTDKTQYQAQSDVGIDVYVRNDGMLPWAGTGDVYIEDSNNRQIAHVATFAVDDLKPGSMGGWNYRALVTVNEPNELSDATAVISVNFNSLFLSVGLSGKTTDLNSIRVYEFDSGGNLIGEKNARFEKDAGFDAVTNPSGRLFWHIDGITPPNQTRYFYLYFDTAENGPKQPSSNTQLPQKGKLIAFSGYWGDLYTVRVNTDGTFGNPVLVNTLNMSLLNGIVLADFNNDGFPDIVSGNTYGDIYLYQNKADGTDAFLVKKKIGNVSPTTISNNILKAMTSGDYNNDGNQDFILEITYSDLYLFLGNGDGTFSQKRINSFDSWNNPYRKITGKASADFNGDGNLDLVVGDVYGSVSIVFGNGKGDFSAPVEIATIGPSPRSIYGLAAGDLDNDGHFDVIASSANDGIANILKGAAEGAFKPVEEVPSLRTTRRVAYDIADFNGDGNQDVIAAQYDTPGKLFYFEGNGDGTFKPAVSISTPAYYATAVSFSKTRIAPDVTATIAVPEKIENKLYHFVWNTGSTAPGNYKVHVTLSEGATIGAEKSTPFEIVADKKIDSRVVTDRISYKANETAVITSTVTSLSANAIIENLTIKVSIANPSGQPLYTDTQTIQLLVPGQMIELKTYWNTSTNPPGVYPVNLEVTDASGNVLSTSITNLTISGDINPSVLLKGQISVDKQILLSGEPLSITYTVANAGNIDLSQIDLSIMTLHVVEKTAYDTLTDQTSLSMGQSYSNAKFLDTSKYTAKDYLVVLRANISGVEETLAGTYFRVEGAPSAPSLYTPRQGEDVETLTPLLIVNNASDPNDDKLTYEFELYTDSGLSNLIASSGSISEGIGITSWTAPTSLTENFVYYWRARAYDGILYGDWMPLASFRLNIVDDPPTAPNLSAPADNSEVSTLTPILTVSNSSDLDSSNLTYNFELALDATFNQIVSSQLGVFEGQGTTSWQVPLNLNENTTYYWRAQADDWLITGPWMTLARFFVNTTNEAPAASSIIIPADGSEITTLYTDITTSNSTDPDSVNLTYIFEVDSVMTFDSPGIMRAGNIPEGQGTTQWHIDNLSDNTRYYVRVKASDGLAESPWSDVIGFFVNTVNDPPTAPILANPSDGGAVNAINPTLSVLNSTDIDSDVLTYEFELYRDSAMTNLVSSGANIQETPEITSWSVPVNLTENMTYYWRARAYDGELYSDWMPLSSFMVNTANDAPSAPTLNSPADGSSIATLTPTLSIHNATDPDSDSLTYDFEIFSGGVLFKTITGVAQDSSGITSMTLDTTLPDNTTYTWRARAYDGDRYGAWMDMAAFSIHLPSKNINATIDFDPDTLNKKSNGTWVVVYIELPAGYNVADINISSLLLNGTVHAESWPFSIGDYDKDGIPDLMVKFKRSDVINLLPTGDKVTVKVTGIVGSTTFDGIDVIRVIP